MNIAIKATGRLVGGARSYLENIVPELARLDCNNTYELFLSEGQELELTVPPNVRLTRVEAASRRAAQRMCWEQIKLPAILRDRKADVLYCPTNIGCLRAPCPSVVALRSVHYLPGHDDSTDYLSISRKRSLAVAKLLTSVSLRKAKKVIAISETAADLIRERVGLSSNKIVVIRHGHNQAFVPSSNNVPRENMLLAVSTVARHKNYGRLIEAFAELSMGSRRMTLEIAGSLVDTDYYSQLYELAARLGVTDRVKFLGDVPYSKLPGVYQRAACFAFVSLAETFGQPLLEAMACGVPIVASDASFAREVCGDAAIYVNPRNHRQIRNALRRVLSDETLAVKLRRDGPRRALAFSWEVAARKTLGVLMSVARKKKSGI